MASWPPPWLKAIGVFDPKIPTDNPHDPDKDPHRQWHNLTLQLGKTSPEQLARAKWYRARLDDVVR